MSQNINGNKRIHLLFLIIKIISILLILTGIIGTILITVGTINWRILHYYLL